MEEDSIEQVLSAIEHALGIKTESVDMATGKLTISIREIDVSHIRKLYKDPRFRVLIDKFLEVGKVDKSKLGLEGA